MSLFTKTWKPRYEQQYPLSIQDFFNELLRPSEVFCWFELSLEFEQRLTWLFCSVGCSQRCSVITSDFLKGGEAATALNQIIGKPLPLPPNLLALLTIWVHILCVSAIRGQHNAAASVALLPSPILKPYCPGREDTWENKPKDSWWKGVVFKMNVVRMALTINLQLRSELVQKTCYFSAFI